MSDKSLNESLNEPLSTPQAASSLNEKTKERIAQASAAYEKQQARKGVSNPRDARKAERDELAEMLAGVLYQEDIPLKHVHADDRGTCVYPAGQILNDLDNKIISRAEIESAVKHLRNGGGGKYRQNAEHQSPYDVLRDIYEYKRAVDASAHALAGMKPLDELRRERALRREAIQAKRAAQERSE